ncbi:hypothetical protein C10C_0194 [Chlamydia serpentis]|uniref:Uncharacterized protein n=1 Tax=Chlamydia serpentis TaxID=1967782 RepID=A0A2R8FAE7_9CHLA|nr:hypothetical protein [Chlamydia serpentis]SPN73374.1 hypothetical protein C10C_0194 [Chlamydia serpentis]
MESKISNILFLKKIEDLPKLFKNGFVRDNDSLVEASDWLLSSKNTVYRSLLGAIPILGNILGAGRIYSVWYTSNNDSIKQVIWHTIFGILEVSCLGILALALKIVLTIIHYLLLLLCEIPFILIRFFAWIVPTYQVSV